MLRLISLFTGQLSKYKKCHLYSGPPGAAWHTLALRTLAASHALISGMDSSNQSLLIGNLQQQSRKLVALLPTESGEQSLLVLPCHLADFLQDFSAIFRQVERIQAPVFRIWSPLHDSPLFEIVQDRHQPAGMYLQPCGEFLLARSGSTAQQTQDSRIRRCKVENP